MTDRDGQFATLAQRSEGGARLSTLLEYPELSQPLPAGAPLPADFERSFPDVGIARIRRGPLSATLVLGGSSRFFALRYGDAVIEGVRFATAFFGKGQFVPDTAEKRGDGYVFRQSLEAPYYQPLSQKVTPETWGADARAAPAERGLPASSSRRRSPNCQRVSRPHPRGRHPRRAAGGRDLLSRGRQRSRLSRACARRPAATSCQRGTATYRAGANQIRFGPGDAPHEYVQVRGAEPKLPGRSVYITGFTPFDRTFVFEGAAAGIAAGHFG